MKLTLDLQLTILPTFDLDNWLLWQESHINRLQCIVICFLFFSLLSLSKGLFILLILSKSSSVTNKTFVSSLQIMSFWSCCWCFLTWNWDNRKKGRKKKDICTNVSRRRPVLYNARELCDKVKCELTTKIVCQLANTLDKYWSSLTHYQAKQSPGSRVWTPELTKTK